MKRIGLLSDTHGWWDDRYVKYFGECDEIWHAGDIGTMEVAERLNKIAMLRAVYGNIDGSDFNLEFENKKYKHLKTKLLGAHNVINCMLSSLVSLSLGVDEIDLKVGLNSLTSIPNRLEKRTLKNGVTILDNGFNSNPFSARQALKTLSLFKGYKIVITPGFIELNDKQYEENFLFGKEISMVANELWVINKVNKDAIISGARFNNDCVIIIKEYDIFNKDIVNSLYNYDKNTVVLIENDLPDNYK